MLNFMLTEHKIRSLSVNICASVYPGFIQRKGFKYDYKPYIEELHGF